MRPNLLVVGCALVAGCSSVPQLTPIAHPDVTVVAGARFEPGAKVGTLQRDPLASAAEGAVLGGVGSAALAGFYYPLRAPSAQGRKDCSD